MRPERSVRRISCWTGGAFALSLALAAPVAAHPKVESFRQQGMIWAFEVATARADFARWCFAEGLAREIMLRPIGRTVYWMPPYILTDDEFALLAARTCQILEAA